MIEHSRNRAKAETLFLSRHIRSVQADARVSEASAAEQAMEEKTARLRALRLAREAEQARDPITQP